MKYVNPLLIMLMVSSTLLGLAGCGATTRKQDTVVAGAPLQQRPTRQTLPTRQYDKEGTLIPFVATPNPYEAIKGRIHKDAVLQFIDAKKALKKGDLKTAEHLFKTVIAVDDKLSGPWVFLGDIAQQHQQSEEAFAHYQKAIAVNPLNVNAYLPLAKLLREQGRFIEAQNVYADALAQWKDFPEAHLNLAILYDIYLNDPLQAQQHMEAYQFLTNAKDKAVAKWLEELQQRTGIAPNLYIGPSNTSQIQQGEEDKNAS